SAQGTPGFNPARMRPVSFPDPCGQNANALNSPHELALTGTVTKFLTHFKFGGTDRHHRQLHTAPVRAVTGLANRQIAHSSTPLTTYGGWGFYLLPLF